MRAGSAPEVEQALAVLRGLAAHGLRGWLVGGAVRDRHLGRRTGDLDVVVEGDVEAVARSLARRAGGHAFRLSEGFGAWRVVGRRRAWQVDLLGLAATLQEDLAARDFTVNAVAEPLAGGSAVDPFEGLRDIRRGILRAVSAHSFKADALRTLRLVRLACELGFSADKATLTLARDGAAGLAAVSPERVFSELRAILASPRAVAGLGLMDDLGLTERVLPELARLRGVGQNRFHHLDVYGHTLEALARTVELTANPGELFPREATALRALLDEPLADELTRAEALRFGALLHDIAKPQTRTMREGRLSFVGHDVQGAELSGEILRRLRAGGRLVGFVSALTLHHLRLGFLVHRMPLGPRALYEYLRACAPVEVEVTLLSVADRLATRGDGAQRAIDRHLEVAGIMLPAALAWRAQPPSSPVDGRQLQRELGLQPGPQLGRMLEQLRVAAYAGEVEGPQAALELARRLQAERPSPRRPR